MILKYYPDVYLNAEPLVQSLAASALSLTAQERAQRACTHAEKGCVNI